MAGGGLNTEYGHTGGQAGRCCCRRAPARTSVPLPMAMPTSAWAMAAASLTPSPTMATRCRLPGRRRGRRPAACVSACCCSCLIAATLPSAAGRAYQGHTRVSSIPGSLGFRVGLGGARVQGGQLTHLGAPPPAPAPAPPTRSQASNPSWPTWEHLRLHLQDAQLVGHSAGAAPAVPGQKYRHIAHAPQGSNHGRGLGPDGVGDRQRRQQPPLCTGSQPCGSRWAGGGCRSGIGGGLLPAPPAAAPLHRKGVRWRQGQGHRQPPPQGQ